MTIETSDWNWSTTWGAVWVRLGLKNGAWRTLYFKETKGRGGGELPKHSFIFDVLEGDAIGVEPAQIDRVKVSWVEDNGNDSWGFAGLTIRYATPGSGLHTIIDAHGSPELKRFDDAATVIDWIEAVSVENPDPGDGEDPAPTQPDRQAVSRLLAHLRANAGFYNRAIWLMQDTSERTLMLDHALRDQPELRHSIEDTPLGVSGNYVAFRWNRPPTEQELDREERRKQALTPKQDVATLPTRGLFAETHLSSCTACEVRDVTRRDWNESPIPHQPPAIGGVEPGPQSQPLPTPSPGSLPQAVVNIAEAPKAPDPVGLAAALGLLGKSDLFRDMSGLDEVGKLLHDLTTGATTLAAAKQLAAKAIEKLGETKAGGDGGAKGGKALPNETQPGKQVDKLQAVKYAQEAGLLDAEQAADAAAGILGGTPVPASWPAGGAETPGSQVDLTGSVGFGGSNQPDDVRTVQQRLVALGFDWVPTNGTVGGTQSDDVTVKAIKLFQSIVIGSRKVVGDGCVDVGGGTHKWLRAANAPRWLEVPAGSFADGYRNSELEEPEQFDHATSWMTATIEGAGAAYKIAHIDNHPTGTTPALLTLNDFSPPRGGDAQGHAGHETGLDCDMRVPKKDGTAPGTGAEAGITWNKGNGSQVNPDYDRDAMRAMLTAITNQPLWRRTFFNDPVLIGEGLCTAQPDHDDHAHFEINPPVRAGAFELGGGEMWA